MGNSGNDSLNVVLGQIEDELSLVRSARDQVDNVLCANEELRELAKQCSDQSKSSAETLVAQASRLTGLTETIERAASEGVATIKRQASDAQEDITASLHEATKSVSFEANRLAEISKAMELTSAETARVVGQQAADAQKTLRTVADSVVEEASSSMSASAQEAITSLNGGIDEARQCIDSALGSLERASSSLEKSRDTLIEAHESASRECLQQTEETKLLLEASQGQLSEIDTRISTLEGFDVEGLKDEIIRLREAEESNASQIRHKSRILIIMLGFCIAIGLAILVKLLL